MVNKIYENYFSFKKYMGTKQNLRQFRATET